MTQSRYDFKRNLAVIIGINEYSNGIPPLTTPVADAEKLANTLQESYQYQVKTLLNSQATLSGLHSLLADFKNKRFPVGDTTVEVQQSDRIIFYFAGHGIVPTDELEDNSQCRGYLIPTDAKTENLLQTQNLLLSMQDLHDALIELPCRHMLVILDCCFAGAFRSSSYRNAVPARKVYKQRYDRFISEPAWQVITSAAYNQKALDFFGFFGKRESDRTQDHSPFASALFEALEGDADTTFKRGDGIITATEIYSYVRDKIEQMTDERNVRQTPGLFPLQKHDKGEYIFLSPDFDREKLEDAPVLKLENNPYRGLKSYEEKHSSLFFGREELVKQLYTHISDRRHQLTVVLGVSGSGKSSLVKAGLIPCLQNHHEQEFFILPTIRPTKSPFKALAEAVLQNASVNETEKSKEISSLKQKLQEAPNQFIHLIEQYDRVRANTKFLLVVDQFEELVTMCKEETRASFLNFLAQALATDSRLYIVLTLRSDFESRFTDSPLKPYWDAARFQVKAMKSHELRQAIERPAMDKMLDFEPPTLVDRLIDDVGQMPGALSLLSFTLSELYIKCIAQERRTLTQEDYDGLGGAIGSLRQRATEEYDKFDSAEQATLRRVMLRMVTIEDGQVARRRVPSWELKYPSEEENQRVEKILDHFERLHLIVRGQDIGGEPYAEPVHDALVREWDKLEQWQQQERENLILQQHLTFAVNDWDKYKRATGYLWMYNPRLNRLAEVLLSKDDNWLNQLEMEFVQSSIDKQQQFQKPQVTAELQQKAYLVQQLLTLKREVNSLALAVVTVGENLEELTEILSPVQSSLRAAVENARERDILGVGDVSAVAISPNKQYIAYSVSDSQKLRLWDFQGNFINGFLVPDCDRIQSIVFSPDSQALATVSDNFQVHLWTINGELICDFTVSDGNINSLAFSFDCQIILTSTSGIEGKIQLWNLDGNLMQSFSVSQEKVNSVALNGKHIVTAIAGTRSKVQLWNISGNLIKDFFDIEEEINSVAFSPNGKYIVTGSTGRLGKVQLWSSQGEFIKNFLLSEDEISLKENGIQSVAFTSDCQKIICISQCKTATPSFVLRLWNLEGYLIQKLVSPGNYISISADAKSALTGSRGDLGKVTLWDLQGDEIDILSGHQAIINSVAISGDGKIIVSASDDGAWLWNHRDAIRQPLPHEETVKLAAISTDVQAIATGTDNGILRLWNSKGDLLKEFQAYQSTINAIAIHNDGKHIIACGSDDMNFDKIKVWDCFGNLLEERFFEGQTSYHRKVAISADSKTIVSISDVVNIQIWNPQGQLIAENSNGHSAYINAVAISADGKTIVTSSDDETLGLWDSHGKPILDRPLSDSVPNSVAVSADGQYIISGTRDNSVRLWDRRGHLLDSLLPGHKDVVSAVAISQDGLTIVSGSWDGMVRLWWGGNWKNWLQVACDRLRYHPILEDLSDEIEKQACEICRKLVWEQPIG
ncbi:caspase family protein [Scytonema sp. NUACC26]|uniref:nSTAND1 domain-containing NTPase n=1 Tax=Scytonema sp. NUACC26 TaxID=3140176 RepID=UPI0034DC1DAE